MPNQVSKSQFKAKALEFFRQVEVSGESLIITDMASPNWKFGVISHNRMTRFPDDAARFCATGHSSEPVAENDW